MKSEIVKPHFFEKKIKAPPSKSYAQRAILAAIIKGGDSVISNPGNSEDVQALIAMLQRSGIHIQSEEEKLNITVPENFTFPDVIELGESGLSLRMLVCIIASYGQEAAIYGKGSLNQRSMKFFEDELPKLGVIATMNDAKLPIHIKGKVEVSVITVNAHGSSQYISGLIYAFAFQNAEHVSIRVEEMVSVDYVDMSIQVLKDFGWHNISRIENEIVFSERKNKNNSTIHYTVEGDWSNAAMWMAAGATAGDVTISGLDVFTLQGDKKMLESLQDYGCHLSINMDFIRVRKNECRQFYFDATHCPDLIPALVIMAANVNGISIIRGANRLINKESNRAVVLQKELAKMGVRMEFQDDEMVIYGAECLNGAVIDPHHDHRIAMSLAIAGLNASSEVYIENADCVAKSYPNFWEEFQS